MQIKVNNTESLTEEYNSNLWEIEKLIKRNNEIKQILKESTK